MIINPQALGDYVKHIREHTHVRLVDISRKSGISVSYISMIEKGHVNHPSSDLLRRLASALDVSFDHLLKKCSSYKSMKDIKTFGELINLKRWCKGYSLSKLSDLSHTSPGYISQIENGSLMPHINTAKKITKVLDISDELLLHFYDQEENKNIIRVDVTGLSKEDIQFIEKQILLLKSKTKRNE